MKVNQLTYDVAFEISSSMRWQLKDFFEKATVYEVFFLSHYNFFYSYLNHNCQFHKVETFCKYCEVQPCRNHAGVGKIWLLRPADGKRVDLLCTSCRKKRLVKVFGEKYQSPVQLDLLF